jgi:hypothetical protein
MLIQSEFSQHVKFFVTYKYSSLLGHFVSYEKMKGCEVDHKGPIL